MTQDTQERREAVARIIDPSVWRLIDRSPVEIDPKIIASATAPVLAQADAILAALDALPTQPTDEAVLDLEKELLGLQFESGGAWPPARRAAALIRSQSAEIARLQALPLEGLDPAGYAIEYTTGRWAFVPFDPSTPTDWPLRAVFPPTASGYTVHTLYAAPSAPLVGGFGSGSSPEGGPPVGSTRFTVFLTHDGRGWKWAVQTRKGRGTQWGPYETEGRAKGAAKRSLTGGAGNKSNPQDFTFIVETTAPLSPSQPVIRAGDE